MTLITSALHFARTNPELLGFLSEVEKQIRLNQRFKHVNLGQGKHIRVVRHTGSDLYSQYWTKTVEGGTKRVDGQCMRVNMPSSTADALLDVQLCLLNADIIVVASVNNNMPKSLLDYPLNNKTTLWLGNGITEENALQVLTDLYTLHAQSLLFEDQEILFIDDTLSANHLALAQILQMFGVRSSFISLKSDFVTPTNWNPNWPHQVGLVPTIEKNMYGAIAIGAGRSTPLNDSLMEGRKETKIIHHLPTPTIGRNYARHPNSLLFLQAFAAEAVLVEMLFRMKVFVS